MFDCCDDEVMIIAEPSASFFFLSTPGWSYPGSPCFSSSGWSLFERVNDTLDFYSLTSFAFSFIRNMPVPGFSKSITVDILLE